MASRITDLVSSQTFAFATTFPFAVTFQYTLSMTDSAVIADLTDISIEGIADNSKSVIKEVFSNWL